MYLLQGMCFEKCLLENTASVTMPWLTVSSSFEESQHNPHKWTVICNLGNIGRTSCWHVNQNQLFCSHPGIEVSSVRSASFQNFIFCFLKPLVNGAFSFHQYHNRFPVYNGTWNYNTVVSNLSIFHFLNNLIYIRQACHYFYFVSNR